MEGGAGNLWFNAGVVKKVRNRCNISFRKVVWKGEVPFIHKYPRLFAMFNQQEVTVDEMWNNDITGGVGALFGGVNILIGKTTFSLIYCKI